jgi:diguanylate cyclase (GGDEF)-like protein
MLGPARSNLHIGIGTTLSVAFVAVAFLAVAANIIAERSFDAVAPIALPIMRVGPPVANAALATSNWSSRDASRARFHVALDRFDRVTQQRAVSQDVSLDVELRNAVDQLRIQQSQLLAQLADGSDANEVQSFKGMLEARIQVGSELIQAADRSRELLKEYAARYERMRARARASIDSAWKVFGRIVAKQSTVALNRQIEELGTHSIGRTTDENGRALDTSALIATELAIGKTLRENERSFVGSEGKEWVASMQKDLAYLVSTRVTLLESFKRQRDDADRFAQIRLQLKEPSTFIAVEETSATLSDASTQPTLLAVPPAFPIAEAPSIQPNQRKQTVIAWISGGVLLLLIAISVVTVRSVVEPVRRLVKATVRLAQGDTGARVQSGGIKELNALAVAFNSMAEQLALAECTKREYQQELESKVEERTEQLKHLASNDPLTSLPNHRQLFVMLDEELIRAHSKDTMVGVFFLDIDNFKNINDGMGHAFGDKVLKAMAERLQTIAHELGFAARLGGDEFVVVMHRDVSQQKVQAAGERLVLAFHEPLAVEGRALALSISVGASVFPEHGHNAHTLLQTADAALFRAKALGRSQLNMYSADLLEAASAKFIVEQGLRGALDKGEFELVFQPEFSVESRNVELVEALIRWRQPGGRLASPGEFLSVAEESGLIMEMSDWVLRTAVETAARWHHGSWPEACVAINVSSRQLIDSHFVDRVKDLLREHRLPPRCIEIELTETVLQTGRITLESLQQLRAHGISIALDDFGTGYSSLASLQQLPLSRIKLDRSVINEIDTNARALAIARSIVGLARNLGLEITAEGIERPEQLALLMREGPMVMQGFLFSRPLAESNVVLTLPTIAHRGRLLLLANAPQALGKLQRNPIGLEAPSLPPTKPDRDIGANLRLI